MDSKHEQQQQRAVDDEVDDVDDVDVAVGGAARTARTTGPSSSSNANASSSSSLSSSSPSSSSLVHLPRRLGPFATRAPPRHDDVKPGDLFFSSPRSSLAIPSSSATAAASSPSATTGGGARSTSVSFTTSSSSPRFPLPSPHVSTAVSSHTPYPSPSSSSATPSSAFRPHHAKSILPAAGQTAAAARTPDPKPAAAAALRSNTSRAAFFLGGASPASSSKDRLDRLVQSPSPPEDVDVDLRMDRPRISGATPSSAVKPSGFYGKKRDDALSPAGAAAASAAAAAERRRSAALATPTASAARIRSMVVTPQPVRATQESVPMKRSFSASAAPTRIAKSEILKNVTFSISGLQNPKRDQIRNVALSLGATYVPDLSAVSTPSKDRHKQPSRLHLLLSPFEVTPKSDELVRSRHPGAVVVPDYVVQCAERGERLGLDRFALWVGGDGVDDAIARFMKGDGAGGNIGTAARGRSHASDFPRQRGAEERQLEEDGDHGDWVPTTRRVPSRSDGAAPATRFGSEAKKARMEKGSSGGGGHGLARLSDKLNDCLKGVVVSFDGEMPLPDVMVLRRYVMACGGDWVIDQPQDATILCTHRGTRRELPKAAQSFGIVVRPAWITACWNEQTLQDYVPFEVV